MWMRIAAAFFVFIFILGLVAFSASSADAQEAPPVATATAIVTVNVDGAPASGGASVSMGDSMRIDYHGMEQVAYCKALADAGDPANGVQPSQEYIDFERAISVALNIARPWDVGDFTIACEGDDWVLQPFVVVSPPIAFP